VDLPIQNAAQMMIENRCSSLLVQNQEGDFVGIVTGNDLRKKVVAKGYDIKKPVQAIMSSPLRTISENSQIFEGMMQMTQDGIKHLAVTDIDDKIVGVISNNDFVKAQETSPFFLLREISKARSPEEIIAKDFQLPQVIRNMVFSGAKAQNINSVVTTVADVILDKMIRFTLAELGEPPVKFAVLIFGSQGRREQTLKTDQDNAVIFEEIPADKIESVQGYFLQFGELLCDRLNQCGYDYCEGGIMAKNPKYCQPVSVWKNYFSTWIHKASPEDLLMDS